MNTESTLEILGDCYYCDTPVSYITGRFVTVDPDGIAHSNCCSEHKFDYCPDREAA